MNPSASLKARVLDAVRQHPVPRRTDRLPLTIGLAAAAALAMFAVIQWFPPMFGEIGGVAHAGGRPASSGAWIVAGTFVLAASATRLALPFRRSIFWLFRDSCG